MRGLGLLVWPMLVWLGSAGLLPAADPSVEALHRAARAGNVKEVETLIAAGVGVNDRDSLGATPLHDAAWAGETEVVKFLIRAGADVNARHNEGGSTPLHYAVLMNRPEVVDVLLDNGADLNIPYKAGEKPFTLAAAGGFGRIAALLIARGANINAQDATGSTALEGPRGKAKPRWCGSCSRTVPTPGSESETVSLRSTPR